MKKSELRQIIREEIESINDIVNLNTKFDVGDKFIDINSNKKEIFTVTKTDSEGVYDEDGWYRLNKNCKKTKKK